MVHRSLSVTLLKVLMTVVVVVFAVVAVSPKARLSLVWASGRSGGCAFADTLNSHDLLVNMVELGEQIGAASRVVQQDPSGIELVETSRGRYWTVKDDRFLRFTLAEEEFQIYGAQGRGVRPGDVVLDCGANVGAFTRAAMLRGARLVVAIEPAPVLVECLRRNFEREISEGRVIVYPKGVWDRVDTLELALGGEGNTTGSSFVFGRDAKRKVRVPLTTIDIVVDELHLPRVDFIKMDIEGAEKQALRGAAETIKKFRPRMAIASEHLPDDVQEIPKVVSALLSAYRVTPSSCKDAFLSVRPEVLLFEAK